MKITDPTTSASPDGTRRISARIGDQALWFEVPGKFDTPLRGEPFVAAALLPAMRRGEPLVGHEQLPVCPVFRHNLDQLQAIFRLWGEAFGHLLTVIDIEVPLAPRNQQLGAGTIFSGDIDQTWTALSTPEPLAEALFVRGLECPLDHPQYPAHFAQSHAWLESRGVRLTAMASNIRLVGRNFGFDWNSYRGAAYAALAHVAGFSTTYLAASTTWSHLDPDGSSPLSDPFWSSASQTIAHHGSGARRWQKLERIAEDPIALGTLRVCWRNQGVNCGECDACLEAMLLLRLLQINTALFPPLDLDRIAAMMPINGPLRARLNDAFDLAVDRNDRPAQRAIRRATARADRARIVRLGDLGFLGGMLGRRRTRSVGNTAS